MSTTTQAIELPRELVEAHEAARAALGQSARIDEQSATLPAQIKALKESLATLREDLARCEIDATILPPKEQSQAARQADALRARVEAVESELTNATRRLQALANRASEIDAVVLQASQTFQAQLHLFAKQLVAGLAVELNEALEPVRDVLGKMHALTPLGQCRDFFQAAFIPADLDYIHLDGQTTGKNLIAVAVSDPAMKALLEPFVRTYARLRAHQPYEMRRPRDFTPSSHGIRLSAGADLAFR
jgi:chromosome segregation ATPase